MKEEILKAINELPKVKSDNPISTMNGINVNDLMDAVERFDKVPTYQQLLEENKSLQSQLKAKEDNWNYIKKMLKEARNEEFNIIGYCGTCTDVDIDFLLNKMEELEILSKGENK